MRIEHVFVGVIIVLSLLSFMRWANRSEADKANPSWAVRGLNAAGANVEATRLLPATKELVGRGLRSGTKKVRGAAAAKTADIKAKAAEASEARRERVAEIADKAREAAARRGLAVVEAVERRWAGRDGDRPFVQWRRRQEQDQEQPVRGETGPQADAVQDADHTATATTTCQTCDSTHTVTLAADEKRRAVKCTCGTPLVFIRNTDPTETPRLRLVPKEDTDMTATTDAPQTIPASAQPATADALPQIPMPADWRAVANRVAEFEPESDADLINFMSAEIAGMCAYSTAYEQLFETCTKSLGLDPRSVQGLGEFGEHIVEVTQAMALAHKRFIVIYEEVMKMVADGTVMPHNGRFFSGDVAI